MYKENKKNFERYFLVSLWIGFSQKIERFFYVSLKMIKMIVKENNHIILFKSHKLCWKLYCFIIHLVFKGNCC